jgi:hypothetical protein
VKKDIAIEEIREARHRISKRFGHDTKALLDHYREMEKQHPERMLREPSSDEKSETAGDQDQSHSR